MKKKFLTTSIAILAVFAGCLSVGAAEQEVSSITQGSVTNTDALQDVPNDEISNDVIQDPFITSSDVEIMEPTTDVPPEEEVLDPLSKENCTPIPGLESPTETGARLARISGQWILGVNGRWWYRHDDDTYTRNGWEWIDGKCYHFDGDGWMDVNMWIHSIGPDLYYWVGADGTGLTLMV